MTIGFGHGWIGARGRTGAGRGWGVGMRTGMGGCGGRGSGRGRIGWRWRWMGGRWERGRWGCTSAIIGFAAIRRICGRARRPGTAAEHGLTHRGQQPRRQRMAREVAEEILRLRGELSSKQLAALFDVAPSTIRHLKAAGQLRLEAG